MIPRTRFCGLLRHRVCLLPTWRGLLLLCVLLLSLSALLLLRIHPFLALNEPIKADALVVEGWVPNYVLREALDEFRRGHYRKLYVTGVPIETGGLAADYQNYAELAAATLIRMGIDSADVEAVPAPHVRQDRTYTSALALKARLHQLGLDGMKFNLVSISTHARRSHLLFATAFGTDSQVGIISVENREYDPIQWWKYSAGVRSVIDEVIAYLYARLVFPYTTVTPR